MSSVYACRRIATTLHRHLRWLGHHPRTKGRLRESVCEDQTRRCCFARLPITQLLHLNKGAQQATTTEQICLWLAWGST